MSFQKKLFGVFFIILSFLSIFFIGYINQFLGNSSGKVVINKDLNKDLLYFIKDDNKYVLLYFGYVGCTTICEPSLTELSKLGNTLDKNGIAFYFLNIKPSIDKDVVENYSKYFYKNFNGIYLNSDNLKKISDAFNLKYSNVLINDFEINHTGYLYLIEKVEGGYILKNMYTNRPFDIENISKDLVQLQK